MTFYLQVQDLPQTQRQRYLDSLPEPQEWFLEELVRSGEFWNAPDTGHAVFSSDTLVEFHTNDSAETHAQLSNLMRQRAFKKVLCKSFEPVLIEAAQKLGWTPIETGFLFRKRNQVALNESPNFQFLKATPADLPQAWEIGRDFYDSINEVEQIYQANGLWIGSHNGQMVGNGVTIPIDGSGKIVDVGMVTRPSLRNKGYASLIITKLADMLERDGKRPICGCAQSNRASKAALEKAGFISEHRLVQITVPE